MGSHENCPSLVQVENHNFIELNKYLETKLPFLFKVLSINLPLSIQVHPDKGFAELLNKNFPDIYKDNNHKPEMAIAISNKFFLLYQFVGLDDLMILLKRYSCIFEETDNISSTIGELTDFYQHYLKLKNGSSSNELEEFIEKIKVVYRYFFTSLLDIDQCSVEKIVKKLLEMSKLIDFNNYHILYQQRDNFVELLFSKFNFDRGIILALFMNYLELNKGDTLFISPNEPHAYIYGDCLECMANSDNTIRLGLTPKLVDIENFKKIFVVDIFNTSLHKNVKVFTQSKENHYEFDNINDFALISYKLKQNEEIPSLSLKESSILFLLEGKINIELINNNNFSLNLDHYDKVFIQKGSLVRIRCSEDSEIFIATSSIK
jgi:mannose-6-phosphate isomerase